MAKKKKTNPKRKKAIKAIAQAAFEPNLTNIGNYSLTGKSPAKAKSQATGVKRALKNAKSRIAKRGAAKSRKAKR
jgi:hypothetical protein